MGWQSFAKDYLTFSRKERIGIIVLICLVFFIWLSPTIFHSLKTQKTITDTGWASMAKNLRLKQTEMEKNEIRDENPNALVFDRSADPKSSGGELFYFDPNKATAYEWRRLGIREKTIKTILHYLAKGGHFHKSSDLSKIYGLDPETYERLEPFIKIDAAINRDKFSDNIKDGGNKTGPVTTSLRPRTIDVNYGDTAAFISLPGIGSKLSARIVSFREKLGGFYSIEQVGETFGLADTTFQKIKKYLSLSNSEVKTFNINLATKDEMKSHPYIRWNLANAIVEYRNQHGNFSSLDDLKKISLITDEILTKIRPYLETR
jgi:competence protein ComEA